MRQKTRYISVALSSILLFFTTGVSSVYAQNPVSQWVTDNFFAKIGNAILGLFGQAVRLGGMLLDETIKHTVVNMSEFVGGITAIDLSWRIFRDVANIFFIFILLYAAIATILHISNFQTKQVVTRLIIIALLVNFSLFFTKAIVDVSNIAALQFYNAMEVCDDPPCAEGEEKGVGEVIMNSLRLTSVYNPQADAAPGAQIEALAPDNIFSITVIGSIFFLVAAFVFFAGAILFIIRFALLILLMVIAPFAFIAYILPSTQQYFKQWMETLLKQAFFAPIYLAITYLVVRIVTDPSFKSTLYQGGATLADGLASTAAGGITAVLAFGLVITLLVATLIIAQSMSLKGADTFMRWGKSARSWGLNKISRAPSAAARNTVGRAASALASREGLKDAASRSKIARTTLKSLRGIESASFDPRKGVGKGGYGSKLKEQVKSREKFAESLGSDEKEVEKLESQKNVQKGVVDKQKEQVKSARSERESAQAALEKAKARGDKDAITSAAERIESFTATLKKEERKLKEAKGTLSEHEEAVKLKKSERQRTYAEKLESSRPIETIFLKVPRKNREASKKIYKSIDEGKKDSDELKELIEKGFKEIKEESA